MTEKSNPFFYSNKLRFRFGTLPVLLFERKFPIFLAVADLQVFDQPYAKAQTDDKFPRIFHRSISAAIPAA